MQVKRYVCAGLAAVVVLVALAGCGGGGDALDLGDDGSKQLVATDAPTPRFVPTVIKVPVQTEATFSVVNQGTRLHNFSVSAIAIDRDVEPGQSVQITLPPVEGGTMTFYDKRYQGEGMQGKLEVSG